MTREEYEQLLKSDYWKGYSYSLIKERNFTCEDCGRSFPNERNKLQVHHLVYRDVYPWSYKPEEVVVLCEECHMKRHGLYVDPIVVEHAAPVTEDVKMPQQKTEPKNTNKYESKNRSFPSGDNYDRGSKIGTGKRFQSIYKVCGILMLIMFLVNIMQKHDAETEEIETSYSEDLIPAEGIQEAVVSSKNEEGIKPENNVNKPSSTSKQREKSKTSETAHEGLPIQIENPVPQLGQTEDVLPSNFGSPTQERNTNESASTKPTREKTTLEILEERNHADVVKQAQRAGVSTEGTTTEILERITHADVVKQAKRAGVSTEGTTTEILERITHADVVKQAQRAGVSTEGTTTEILERITRKSLENY